MKKEIYKRKRFSFYIINIHRDENNDKETEEPRDKDERFDDKGDATGSITV